MRTVILSPFSLAVLSPFPLAVVLSPFPLAVILSPSALAVILSEAKDPLRFDRRLPLRTGSAKDPVRFGGFFVAALLRMTA